MALRKIVEQGDECLTKVCRPVTKFDRRLHDLLDDMALTVSDLEESVDSVADQIDLMDEDLAELHEQLDDEDEDEELDEDTVMMDALDAGAADFQPEEGCFTVYTDPDDINTVA